MSWVTVVDPLSGATYYYNEQTFESQWEPPETETGLEFYNEQTGLTTRVKQREPHAADEESIADLSAQAIDRVLGMLAVGTAPPPAVLQLKTAVAYEDEAAMRTNIYLLVVEQALHYDTLEADGRTVLVPTALDYSNPEDPRVKKKMRYAYSYGIEMFKRGLMEAEQLKQIVLERLAGGVGMDGPTFDQYLEMPAV